MVNQRHPWDRKKNFQRTFSAAGQILVGVPNFNNTSNANVSKFRRQRYKLIKDQLFEALGLLTCEEAVAYFQFHDIILDRHYKDYHEQCQSLCQTFLEILKIAILIAPVVSYIKAIWNKYTLHLFQRTFQKHNILYVIAHPDDEAMFFAPSIIELRKSNNLYLLCLSTGNADGLGKIREKELQQSAAYFGFSACYIVDDKELQDGKESEWSVEAVARQVEEHLVRLQGEMEVNVIVTFDPKGISGHPNHIAVHQGVAAVFNEEKYPFDVFCLTTLSIFRKYSAWGEIYNCGYEHQHQTIFEYYRDTLGTERTCIIILGPACDPDKFLTIINHLKKTLNYSVRIRLVQRWKQVRCLSEMQLSSARSRERTLGLRARPKIKPPSNNKNRRASLVQQKGSRLLIYSANAYN